jgi:hypothetical protein
MTLTSKCFEREILRVEARARFARVNLVAESYRCKLLASMHRPRWAALVGM